MAVLLAAWAASTPAAAAVVSRVQSGQATSAAPGIATVTIQAVNPAASFLVFQTRHASNRPVGSSIRGRLASPTSIEFERVSDENSVMDIQWSVVEFASGVRVQRGELECSPPTVTTTITPVGSTAQAFVLWSKTAIADDTATDANDFLAADLRDESTLRFRLGAVATNHWVAWQVVEFTNPSDVLVQHGSTALSRMETTVTANLPVAVDLDTSFVLVSHVTPDGGDDIGARMIHAQLDSPTSLTITRAATGDRDELPDIVWQVVDLRDGSRVQRGLATFAIDERVATERLAPPVRLDSAVALATVNSAGGQNAGSSPLISDDVLGVGCATLLLSPTQVELTRNEARAPATIGWSVIEFASSGVELRSDSTLTVYPASTDRPVWHPHFVRNRRDDPQEVSFASLSAEGWAAGVFTDPNCDGDIADGLPVTAGVSLGAGEEVCIVHELTVPAGTPTGTTDSAVLKATGSRSGQSAVTDKTSIGDRFTLAPDYLFSTGNGRLVSPNSSVLNPHRLINRYDLADSFFFSFTSSPGFSVAIFTDPNGDGDPADGVPLPSPAGPVAPLGGVFDIVVEISVGNLPLGTLGLTEIFAVSAGSSAEFTDAMDETRVGLELCANGLDDDGDGETDCDDADCIGHATCVNEDWDGDGSPNGTDCAPQDGTLYVEPGPVSLLSVRRDATGVLLAWSDAEAPGTGLLLYEVASDRLDALARPLGAVGPCIQRALPGLSTVDARPPNGIGWYYLTRGINACGPVPEAGWGEDSLGSPRRACP